MGAFDALAKLILLVAYAAYSVIGLILLILGIYYVAQIPDAIDNVAIVVSATGFGMMVVGGLAEFSLVKQNWLILGVVWVVDVALFSVLLLCSVFGLVMGMDIKNPSRTAVNTAWEDPAYLVSQWDLAFCQEALYEVPPTPSQIEGGVDAATNVVVSATCGTGEGGFDAVATDKLSTIAASDPDWDLSSYNVRDIFSNCSAAYPGGCVTDINGTCVATLAAEGLRSEAFGDLCTACSENCREGAIIKVSEALGPGSVLLFVTFFFCIVCVLVNNLLTTSQPEGGPLKLGSLLLNGVVAVLGLTVAIVCAVGYHGITEQCPENADCTNSAVWMVVAISMFMLVLGLLGVLGNKLEIYHFLNVVNLILCILAFALLVAAIFVSIVAGNMQTVNAQSEKHFQTLVETYEHPSMFGPNFCRYNDEDGDGEPDGAGVVGDGGTYMMDPCYDPGTTTEIPRTCSGTSTEVLTCTGTSDAVAQIGIPDLGEVDANGDPLYPDIPGHFVNLPCDLDASTAPGALCPTGCDLTAKTCDLNAATDDSDECPAGCTDIAAHPATCPVNLRLEQRAECPETYGCEWQADRLARDEVLCEEAGATVDFRCPVFYPLSKEECRLKIKDVIEDELTIIGTVCGIVALGMFVVMWLTWGAVTSLRSDAGDWDDWEGDE